MDPSEKFCRWGNRRFRIKLTTMSKRPTRAQAFGLFGWLALVCLAAGLGAAASIHAAAFYATLVRPSWAPPASAFGPVWSVLYLLMGISAWLVWRERSNNARTPSLAVFITQLAANALWSWLFFQWHDGAAAFVEIVVLLALIVATIVLFWRVRQLAAVLIVPYLGWVCLASALTWSVWRANPALL